MLSIQRIRDKDYHIEQAREDYFFSGGEPLGKWTGEGAKFFGLTGSVSKQALRNLMDGYAPDGSRTVVQLQEGKEHAAGWDLSFSAPKSVSVLWGVGDLSTQKAIQAAHDAAMKAALKALEEEAGWARVGKRGKRLERVKLTIATFEHGTSRLDDPQLHSHALVMNVGVRENGKTVTIDSRHLYRAKMMAGALYRAELAKQLEERLGLELTRKKSWFEIKGISEKLVEEFSKRRTEVERLLREKGLSGPRASAVAALATREKKTHRPRNDLMKEWREVAGRFGLTQEKVKGLLGRSRPARDRSEVFREALKEALERISRTHAHFSEKEVVRFVAEAAQCRGLGALWIRTFVKQELRTSSEVVELGHTFGEERFTTKEMLELEKKLLATADRLREGKAHAVGEKTLEKVFAARPTIRDEQRKAVEHVTRAGAIAVVEGMAGTGKTYMLGAVREAYEREGYKVLGCALAGKAAEGLEAGSGIKSSTIARLIGAEELGFKGDLDKDASEGKATSRKDRITLDARTLVVVDEAAMASNRQVARLLDEVEQAGSKILLVGDSKQIQAIQQGGAFAALAARTDAAKLKEITRQEKKWAREVVHHLAAGRAKEALQLLAAHGQLDIARDGEAALATVISRWKEHGGVKDVEHHVLVAGTNLDVSRLNRLAQAERLKSRVLPGFRVRVGENGLSLGTPKVELENDTLYEGDRILFKKTSHFLSVKNGTLGTVVRIDRARNELTVRLDGGKLVRVDLERYGKENLGLGFCLTVNRAQGMTVKGNVYALASEEMTDREWSYVAGSRAAGRTFLVADRYLAGEDLKDLARRMAKSKAKTLAHDVLAVEREEIEHNLER